MKTSTIASDRGLPIILLLAVALVLGGGCATSSKDPVEMTSKKARAVALLESLETGDRDAVAVINPDHYVQHNLAVGDGLAGFAEVVNAAPPGGFRARVVRAFEDGDFVFTHTEYDFFGPKVGFDVFRFENDRIVEHWDNLDVVQAPNPSGRTQLDGATEATDLDRTEDNRALVRAFVETVLVGGDFGRIPDFVNPERYLQHNAKIGDGLEGLGAAMEAMARDGLVMKYERLHRVLAEGDFVLTMSEGLFGQNEPTSFYDLFRVEGGRIVEHWDVIETIPARDTWKNDNGKF